MQLEQRESRNEVTEALVEALCARDDLEAIAATDAGVLVTNGHEEDHRSLAEAVLVDNTLHLQKLLYAPIEEFVSDGLFESLVQQEDCMPATRGELRWVRGDVSRGRAQLESRTGRFHVQKVAGGFSVRASRLSVHERSWLAAHVAAEGVAVATASGGRRAYMLLPTTRHLIWVDDTCAGDAMAFRMIMRDAWGPLLAIDASPSGALLACHRDDEHARAALAVLRVWARHDDSPTSVIAASALPVQNLARRIVASRDSRSPAATRTDGIGTAQWFYERAVQVGSVDENDTSVQLPFAPPFTWFNKAGAPCADALTGADDVFGTDGGHGPCPRIVVRRERGDEFEIAVGGNGVRELGQRIAVQLRTWLTSEGVPKEKVRISRLTPPRPQRMPWDAESVAGVELSIDESR